MSDHGDAVDVEFGRVAAQSRRRRASITALRMTSASPALLLARCTWAVLNGSSTSSEAMPMVASVLRLPHKHGALHFGAPRCSHNTVGCFAFP